VKIFTSEKPWPDGRLWLLWIDSEEFDDGEVVAESGGCRTACPFVVMSAEADAIRSAAPVKHNVSVNQAGEG
jgi:hypothetical protein